MIGRRVFLVQLFLFAIIRVSALEPVDLFVSSEMSWHWVSPTMTGSRFDVTDTDNTVVDQCLFWGGVLSLQPIRIYYAYNESYPSGGNDGALWQGRGSNASIRMGSILEFKAASVWRISVVLAPEILGSGNLPFKLLPSEYEFGSAFTKIDEVQRFGDVPFFDWWWGDSEVRITGRYMTLGYGTRYFWLGPASVYPVIMSNNGVGFPKLDFGLLPTETRIGEIEARAWWGRLKESDYFDTTDNYEYTFQSGLSASWSPSFVPMLTLGLHRTVATYWDVAGIDDILKILDPRYNGGKPDGGDGVSGNGQDDRDQRASLTVEWNIPDVNMRIYGEWARNDSSSNLSNVLRAVDHTDAFTIGVQQRVDGSLGAFIGTLEFSNLQLSEDYLFGDRWFISGFYSHGMIVEGHTNQGQLLGAYIGGGSNAQYLSVDWYRNRWMVGGYLQRWERNADYLLPNPTAEDYLKINAEWLWALRSTVEFGTTDLYAEFGRGWNVGRNYLAGNRVGNIFVKIGLTYQI